VKIVPSFATNFIVYAMPPPLEVKVAVKLDGTGNVSWHDDWIPSEYGGFCEGHPAVELGCVLTPCMKKSAKVIGAAPSFLMIIVREPGEAL
jgi:hypothetical protein